MAESPRWASLGATYPLCITHVSERLRAVGLNPRLDKKANTVPAAGLRVAANGLTQEPVVPPVEQNTGKTRGRLAAPSSAASDPTLNRVLLAVEERKAARIWTRQRLPLQRWSLLLRPCRVLGAAVVKQQPTPTAKGNCKPRTWPLRVLLGWAPQQYWLHGRGCALLRSGQCEVDRRGAELLFQV